jgi:4-amino-4-deoxy-L-arabinose transferase-like glycosyltransferase
MVSAYLLTTPLLAALLTRRRLVEHTSLLWCWLLIPVPTIAYFHFAPKYVLPALPAVAILAAHGLDRLRQRRAVLAVVATVGTVLGVLILRADAHMAGEARTAADKLIRPRTEAGERVWFAGHSGFQWYAERAGAVAVAIEPPYPAPGEILVASTVDEPGMLCFVPRVLLEEHGDTRPTGRIMSRRVSAGFYSNIFGLWPWGWAPPDTTPFLVSRVTGLPQRRIDDAMRPAWCGPAPD